MLKNFTTFANSSHGLVRELLLETCLREQKTRWFTPSQSMRDCKIKFREVDEWVGIERLTYKGVYYALFETF